MHCTGSLRSSFWKFYKNGIKKCLLGSLIYRIKDGYAYRSGVKVGNRLFSTIEPRTSTAITQLQ